MMTKLSVSYMGGPYDGAIEVLSFQHNLENALSTFHLTEVFMHEYRSYLTLEQVLNLSHRFGHEPYVEVYHVAVHARADVSYPYQQSN